MSVAVITNLLIMRFFRQLFEGWHTITCTSISRVFSTSNALQTPFSAQRYIICQLFTPLESLSQLSTSEYTALNHPPFPKYSVRIKKTEGWCDPAVQGYFYFFEMHNDPTKDDVIFWKNG
ncbi:hypothetical protein BDQ17DRAFT_1422509 [Cyathus striatus]|nr:hypothetical protein BDQ17DRAFT_1422509 [Cyathus striatus]